MPDWENLVRTRLRGLDLDAQRSEEIVAELSVHLEEVFEELWRRGMPEEAAIQQSLQEVRDWKRLCRQINYAIREEHTMNQRVKSLWIPGFVLLVFSVAFSIFANRLFAHKFPEAFLMGASTSIPIDVPWLLTLPLLGALGAYWSRRMGGQITNQLAVCQFPMTATFPIFFVLLPAAYLLIPSMRVLKLSFLLGYELGWVAIPSLALLLGALPVAMTAREARAGSRDAA